MKHTFTLWDLASGNILAAYPNEAAALSLVRQAIEDGDGDLVDDWALGWEDENGNGAAIAQGQELIDRALAAPAASDV